MKYTRIYIKCNENLISNIENILPFYSSHIYLRDFFIEVKNAAKKNLAYAKFRNQNEDVNTEFFVYCPYSVYKEAKIIVETIERNYSELYLLFEFIANLDEKDFII